jgi:hypothetical protein
MVGIGVRLMKKLLSAAVIAILLGTGLSLGAFIFSAPYAVADPK